MDKRAKIEIGELMAIVAVTLIVFYFILRELTILIFRVVHPSWLMDSYSIGILVTTPFLVKAMITGYGRWMQKNQRRPGRASIKWIAGISVLGILLILGKLIDPFYGDILAFSVCVGSIFTSLVHLAGGREVA